MARAREFHIGRMRCYRNGKSVAQGSVLGRPVYFRIYRGNAPGSTLPLLCCFCSVLIARRSQWPFQGGTGRFQVACGIVLCERFASRERGSRRVDTERFEGGSSRSYPIELIESDPRFEDSEWLLIGWTPRYRAFKRLTDLIVGIALLVIFVLTFPFVCIAIKVDSRGSVFYAQERVGLDNSRFRVLKYRSMCQDAEAHGAQFSRKGDPRITRVGNILRTSRLDELPQAINVLRGEMSIVGPRPERAHVIDEVSVSAPAFRLRTVVRPGITGWAQVYGIYAANHEELIDKLEYDLYYIRNASLQRDISVMIDTVRVVFERRGL